MIFVNCGDAIDRVSTGIILFDSVRNQIFVAVGAVANHQFCEVTSQKQHQTKDHRQQRKVEERLVGDLAEANDLV